MGAKILVNIYGAPGAGKTYWAQEIARSLDGAYVSEYATHLIKEGRAELLSEQALVTGGQVGLLQEGFHRNDLVVSDSPAELGYVYCSNPSDLPTVRRLVEGSEEGVHVINILVQHNETSLAEFSLEGRVHGREESIALQEKITSMLDGGLHLEGSLDGAPYSFTPEAKLYIVTERGASLKHLVGQITRQIAALNDSIDLSSTKVSSMEQQAPAKKQPSYLPMRRVIAFDTETTGLQSHEDHRIISMAAVEMKWDEVDGKPTLVPTGKKLDLLFNPEREIDPAAAAVNGFTLETLQDKPKFAEKAKEIIKFIRGEPGEPPTALFAHNATFDVGMLNAEMERAGHRAWIGEAGVVGIGDTKHASARFWFGECDENGKKLSHSLDAVCGRLGVDLSPRANGHGALVDTKLLAEAMQRMMEQDGGHRALAGARLSDKDLRSTRSTTDYKGNIKREFSKEWIAAAALVAPLLEKDKEFCASVADHMKKFIRTPQAVLPQSVPAVSAAIDKALAQQGDGNIPDQVRSALLSIKENASAPYNQQIPIRSFAALCQQTLVNATPTHYEGVDKRVLYNQDGAERIWGRGDVVACAGRMADIAGKTFDAGGLDAKQVAAYRAETLFCEDGISDSGVLGRFMAKPTEAVSELVHAMTHGECEIKYLGKQFVGEFSDEVKECLANAFAKVGVDDPTSQLEQAQTTFQAGVKNAFASLTPDRGKEFMDSRDPDNELQARDMPPAAWVQTLIAAARDLVNDRTNYLHVRGEPVHRAALKLDKALRDMETELHTYVEKQVASGSPIYVSDTMCEVAYRFEFEDEDFFDNYSFTDGVEDIIAAAIERCPEGDTASAANRVFEQIVVKNRDALYSKNDEVADDLRHLNNMEWARGKMLDAIDTAPYDAATCERLRGAVQALEFTVRSSDPVTQELIASDMAEFFKEDSPEEFVNYVGGAAASSKLFEPGEVGDDIIKLNDCTQNAISQLQDEEYSPEMAV